MNWEKTSEKHRNGKTYITLYGPNDIEVACWVDDVGWIDRYGDEVFVGKYVCELIPPKESDD